MADALRKILTGMRQLLFPPEFRISSGAGDDPGLALVLLVREALEQAVTPPPPVTPPITVDPVFPPPAEGIDERMACDLSNELFRLRRNLAQMTREGRESKETRSISRALGNVDDLLRKRGVEYRDLSDTDYDERNIDFQRVGEPEDVPGLDRKKIGMCECPTVTIGGKIVQKAKGVVRRPA